MKTQTVIRLTVLFTSALLLSTLYSCGGGDNGSSVEPPKPQILSGRAAAGAPIIGSVTIKDSSAPVMLEKTVDIAADGTYSVDVHDMTAPFALRADGRVAGRDYHLHSAATEDDLGGTINITPFTDLIIANVAGDLAANYYTSGNLSRLSATELNAAESALQQRLQPILTAVGLAESIDLLRSPFHANHTGLDGVLDVVRVTVDPATATAKILNLISNTAIIDDLRSQTDASAFTAQDAAQVAAGMTDLQLIIACFDRLSALFATSLPSPTNPELPAIFDQATYLDDGTGLNTLLADLTSDTSQIGVKFTDLTVIALDPAAGSGEIAFTPVSQGVAKAGETHRFVMIRKNGTWLMQGNQRIAHASLATRAFFFSGNAGTRIDTGLDPEIRDQGGRGIDYAIVRGPGLPADGVVLVNNITSDHFTFQDSDNDFILMDEAAIATLPDTGAVYTIELWEDNNTDTSTDDTRLAAYTETIPKRPYKPSELTAATFPALTAQGLGNWQAFTGGTLTVAWTLPTGQKSVSLFVRLSGAEGRAEAVRTLAPTQTMATLTITPFTATGTPITVTTRSLDIGVVDGFGRSLSTVYPLDIVTSPITIEEFVVPTASSYPRSLTAGPDGNLWFTEECGNKIGKITPNGVITEFPSPDAPWQLISYDCIVSGVGKGLHSITAGADGNLWFTDSQNNRIWKMNTNGTIIGEYPVDSCEGFTGYGPHGITAGPNGTIWFAHLNCNYIGKLATETGTMTGKYAIPTPASGTAHITAGPGDTIWFSEHGSSGSVNKIGKITQDGTITEYPGASDTKTLNVPFEIVAGNDGNVWFTERGGNAIGRITPEGVISKYPLPDDPSTLYTPLGITAGADNAIWFTEGGMSTIGRIAADSPITKFPIPSSDTGWHITLGPDGNLWFTELTGNRIGKVRIH